MKTLEMNPNGSPHPNSLMPQTWYQISTSLIPPSLVLSHCPEHTVAFVLYLHAFSNRDFPSLNSSIFCPLILINPQLPRTFQGFLLKNFKLLFILILVFFLTHTINSQKK